MSRLTGYEVDGDVITTAMSTIGTALTVTGSVVLGSLTRLAIYKTKRLKPQHNIVLAYKNRKHLSDANTAVAENSASDASVNKEVANG